MEIPHCGGFLAPIKPTHQLKNPTVGKEQSFVGWLCKVVNRLFKDVVSDEVETCHVLGKDWNCSESEIKI